MVNVKQCYHTRTPNLNPYVNAGSKILLYFLKTETVIEDEILNN